MQLRYERWTPNVSLLEGCVLCCKLSVLRLLVQELLDSCDGQYVGVALPILVLSALLTNRHAACSLFGAICSEPVAMRRLMEAGDRRWRIRLGK